eukprot:6193832-Pleurochrysis_carterae.AAC.1
MEPSTRVNVWSRVGVSARRLVREQTFENRERDWRRAHFDNEEGPVHQLEFGHGVDALRGEREGGEG